MKQAVLAAIIGGVVTWWAKPEPQLLLPCTVTEVVDGDTLTAQMVVRTRVRLAGIDAPEIGHPGAEESREHLVRESLGKEGLLRVPLRGRHVGDVFSFSRVVGDILVGGDSMADRQVGTGHAIRVEE